MKRAILWALFYTLFSVAALPAQDTVQNNRSHFQISSGYNISILAFSWNYLDSKSVLTWRDMYLHAGWLNINLGNVNILGHDELLLGACFATSFHGYSTDDDANNAFNVITVHDAAAYVLDIEAALIKHVSAKLGRITAFDFNWTGLTGHNQRIFSRNTTVRDIEGIVYTYEIFKLGIYTGMQYKIVDKRHLSINLDGLLGLGIMFDVANWLHRADFSHPISFIDIGLLARTGATLDIGLRFGAFTLSAKLKSVYEFSPLNMRLTYGWNGKIGLGLNFMDLFRNSLFVGVKMSR